MTLPDPEGLTQVHDGSIARDWALEGKSWMSVSRVILESPQTIKVIIYGKFSSSSEDEDKSSTHNGKPPLTTTAIQHVSVYSESYVLKSTKP